MKVICSLKADRLFHLPHIRIVHYFVGGKIGHDGPRGRDVSVASGHGVVTLQGIIRAFPCPALPLYPVSGAAG